MRYIHALLTCCVVALPSSAAVADAAVEALKISPAEFTLVSARSYQQLAVTANPEARTIFDASAAAEFQSLNEKVAVVRDGIVYPVGDGQTEIRATLGGRTASAHVTVREVAKHEPVVFGTEVLAALTKAGCNMGACHGSPSGKGGFRLSLRGYDPELDLLTLRGEFFNRRSNLLKPEESLLLRKPLMVVAHGGGQRLQPNQPVYNVLKNWIAEGMRAEQEGTPVLERIKLLPEARVLRNDADRQQLVVQGYFSDGSVRDVTPLTAFDSSDEAVASVSASAMVRREGRGEATILARYLDRMSTSQITFLTDREGYDWQPPEIAESVDQLVFKKLYQLQIQPSDLCSDSDFLRRATLDLTGRLPTVEETTAFLEDTTESRRSAVIDRLLAHDDYARFWSLKWADLLRCNSRRLTSTGVHKFRRWLFDVVRTDMPLNRFAHELLTARGSTQHNPAANYWRASRDEIDATETTAQLFLGIRIQCAKCHNHPFEKWTQDDYYGIAAAFHRVGRKATALPQDEFIFVKDTGEVTQPRTGQTMKVRLLLQGSVDVPADQDRRAVFADWLTADTNPFFARSVANRIWGHVMGRGIVEPVDDFRDSNPPSNPELLNFLVQELVASNYSAKHLIRTIMNSRVYQLSSERNTFNQDDEIYFSHATTRMLTAEQLLDAICDVTGVPEQYKGMPAGTKAIDLVDPPDGHKFLQVFGQPQRELACECERSSDSNLSQALQLINGPVVHNKVRSEQGNIHRWIAAGQSDRQIISQLYLTALSREPAEQEFETALKHIAASENRTTALEDVAWAVINSKEFLFQH
ncbi:MAG: DUF1549 and DUF1553 domain-containing protein [Fuerstiella sp.]